MIQICENLRAKRLVNGKNSRGWFSNLVEKAKTWTKSKIDKAKKEFKKLKEKLKKKAEDSKKIAGVIKNYAVAELKQSFNTIDPHDYCLQYTKIYYEAVVLGGEKFFEAPLASNKTHYEGKTNTDCKAECARNLGDPQIARVSAWDRTEMLIDVDRKMLA